MVQLRPFLIHMVYGFEQEYSKELYYEQEHLQYIFQKYPPTCEFGLNNNIIRGSPNPIINPRHSDMNIHTLVCSHPPHKHNSAYADPVTDFTVTIVTHSLIAEVVMERKSISEAVTQ